ncbi:MAG: hypothetical protein IKI58_04165 [Oscillospiraceae bacterium]|nr:hypothetical protein [Oscillospiraceae bacterium]
MTKELYLKFPRTLREALVNGIVSFHGVCVEVAFSPIPVLFRVVQRDGGDLTPINESDFMSYAELGKQIKGVSGDSIDRYSCSMYLNKDELSRALHLPRKKKYIIVGDVNNTNGVIHRSQNSSHVDVWLYDGSNIQHQFRFEGDSK